MSTREREKPFKKRIFEIIQIGTKVDFLSRAFDYFITCIILISISVTFMLTFEEMQQYAKIMEAVEFFTIVIFIFEYILRLWTSDYLYPNVAKSRAFFKFIFSFYGIVDLLTIISYFEPLYSNGIVALRIIRVIRILRLFQLSTNSDTFNVVGDIMSDKKNELLSSLTMIAMLMLSASLCMYGFEHDAQPRVFENAFSGIWWAMSTVLTVGYGDIYPITIGGKIMAIIIALLGVCVVAIPTGIISAGFVEYDARLQTEAVLRSDKDGLVNQKVISYLRKRARNNKMSVNEYLLYLIARDDNEAEDTEDVIENNKEDKIKDETLRQMTTQRRKKKNKAR